MQANPAPGHTQSEKPNKARVGECKGSAYPSYFQLPGKSSSPETAEVNLKVFHTYCQCLKPSKVPLALIFIGEITLDDEKVPAFEPAMTRT